MLIQVNLMQKPMSTQVTCQTARSVQIALPLLHCLVRSQGGKSALSGGLVSHFTFGITGDLRLAKHRILE